MEPRLKQRCLAKYEDVRAGNCRRSDDSVSVCARLAMYTFHGADTSCLAYCVRYRTYVRNYTSHVCSSINSSATASAFTLTSLPPAALQVIRPHRSTTYYLAIVSDVVWSVGLCLSRSWALQNCWTDRDAVYWLGWAQLKHALDGGAHWRHMVSTTEPSMCGGD